MDYWSDYSEYKNIACPECGFEYVHFEDPKVIPGNDSYDAPWNGRGDLLVVPMWGECGAKWQICFGFHKGYTATFVRIIESCQSSDLRFVYFIEAMGMGKVKIGISNDPGKRLRQLSTGFPVELKLIAKIPGDRNLEKQLHNRFNHFRVDKEWFYATKELRDYIKSIG